MATIPELLAGELSIYPEVMRMSRARVNMICMLATMVAHSISCSAQAPGVIAQKLCAQLDQANADRDLNRVLGFFDSSYVDTDWRGNHLGFAEFREQVEQNFPHYRHMSPSTTVEDVQLQAGRMVVSYKTESHFQFNDQRNGWTPMISKATGETTWEKKGDQWKIIRRTTLRYDVQVDPQWAQAQMDIIMNTRYYDKDGR